MTGWDNGPVNPSIEVGRSGVDVVESGPERPSRVPARLSAEWVAMLVAVAAVLGYWAGGRHRDAAPPTPPTSATPFVGQPITGTGKRCSEQLKTQLQLGVEVVNRSASTVSLHELQAILPMGGLRPKSATWGSCGQLPAAGSGGNYLLAAAGTTWLTITFDVLVDCPGPRPVLFTVEYSQAGQSDAVDLPGFPDLGDVPYSGAKC